MAGARLEVALSRNLKKSGYGGGCGVYPATPDASPAL